MSASLIVNENSINSPNECSSVLVNESLPSIKIDNVFGPSTVVPLNSNNVSMYNNDQPCFFPPEKESNLPKICPSLKDIVLSEGDDICKGVDLEVALNFNCGYEMVGCSQEQYKNLLDNGGLDCLAMKKPLPVTESNNQIKNSLEFGEAIICSDAASEAAKYGFAVVDRPEGVLVLAVASLGEKVVEVITPMFMLPATLASSMFSAIRDRVNCRLVLHFVQRKNRRVSPTKTHVFSTKTREVL